ncbi:unnamed protein product [Rotaria sp. Silwood2]|nr:unnamed protein product [Rotaria sp. Silwood2]
MMKAGEVEFYLHKNDTMGALQTLGEIIQELMSQNDCVHDEKLKDMLIMSCIKRININFKEKKLSRASIASLCKETITVELKNFKINSNEMEAGKENVGVDFNTKPMFSKYYI